MTTDRSEIFGAIADPTRRTILQLLQEGERSAGWIADLFDVTPPAISQHLRVLREAGLVEHRKEGRMRYYRARPEALQPVIDWLGYFDAFWERGFERLGRHLRRNR